jgi:hypothetical protein
MGGWFFSSFFFLLISHYSFIQLLAWYTQLLVFWDFFPSHKNMVVARYSGHIESDLNSEVMNKGMNTKPLNKMEIWRHMLLQNNTCGVAVLEMKQKIAKLCCEGRQPRNLVTVMSPEYRFQMQETCLHDDWLDLLFLLEVSNCSGSQSTHARDPARSNLFGKGPGQGATNVTFFLHLNKQLCKQASKASS